MYRVEKTVEHVCIDKTHDRKVRNTAEKNCSVVKDPTRFVKALQ